MPKKVTITFKNPVDETNVDHMEVWWKLGAGGTYAQLGADIPFVTGTADYSVEDTSGNVVDGANLYYEARAYNAAGDYSAIAKFIQVASGFDLSPLIPDVSSYIGGPYGATADGGEVDDGASYAGDVYYISATGDDNADGLTPETAWQTLDKVNSKTNVRYWDTVPPNENTNPPFHEPWTSAPSGSAFLFKRGDTFSGVIRVHPYTVSGYTNQHTFGAYGTGARPVINYVYDGVRPVCAWTNGHTIYLRNLKLVGDAGSPCTGIDVSATSDSVISNCEVIDMQYDGILGESSTNLMIDNSTISNNRLNGGQGGGIAAGGTGMIIRNCTMEDNGRNAVLAHNVYIRYLTDAVVYGNYMTRGSNLGLVIHGSSDNVIIAGNHMVSNNNGIDVTGGYPVEEVFNEVYILNNIIEDNGQEVGQSQGYGLLLKSITSSVIANNVVSNNKLGAMSLESKNSGDISSSNVLCAHNTFSEPNTSWGCNIKGDGMSGISVVNNIFDHAGDNTKRILTKYSTVAEGDLMLDNNLYYMPNRADGEIFDYDGVGVSFATLVSFHSRETNGAYGNPDFEVGNYRVENTSAAGGLGVVTSITEDFDDVTRLDPPTSGAYKINP